MQKSNNTGTQHDADECGPGEVLLAGSDSGFPSECVCGSYLFLIKINIAIAYKIIEKQFNIITRIAHRVHSALTVTGVCLSVCPPRSQLGRQHLPPGPLVVALLLSLPSVAVSVSVAVCSVGSLWGSGCGLHLLLLHVRMLRVGTLAQIYMHLFANGTSCRCCLDTL